MSKNMLHRLGESILTNPENSLARLRDHLNLQTGDTFRYWEFDIQESLDHIVFVYHDRDFKGKKLRKLTYSEIQELIPHVCTLEDVLGEFVNYIESPKKLIHVYGLKPIRVEIKLLFSDIGRTRAVGSILRFKEYLSGKGFTKDNHVQFIAFPSHFKKTFPNGKKAWWKISSKNSVDTRQFYREIFQENGLYVLSVKKKFHGMHVYDLFSEKYVL